MPKKGQRQVTETSARQEERQAKVAKGGSTRVSHPRQGRSGSDSNKSSGTRGH